MNQDLFEREGNFSLAMTIIRTLQGKGLLSEREAEKVKKALIVRFNPVWGHLPGLTPQLALSNQT